MKSSFWQRHPQLVDIISVIIFVVSVIIGTILINTFVFQSYTVIGQSMEETLHDGERIIVNRLPITWSKLQNNDYTPKRGDIIVFENPNYTSGMKDQYIVKRVIAFSGERVEVSNGVLTIYNTEHPDGFNPDDDFNGEPKEYTSHDGKWTVPDKEIFVAGDNREGNNSLDSRSGLGTVPLYDIIGPVKVRLFPFDKFRLF
ncbi:MAG: signal peptidase I [Candidatus Sacchiramonaceae bacterium]|nr:signal peptidase I [Candidatus Saccharimonadaceae bacterium]